MSREHCTMGNWIGNELYCDYYDYAFMLCKDVQTCPDGCDNEDEEEYDLDYGECEYD